MGRQEPPVSGSLLLSPLLAAALVNRGPGAAAFPLLLSPVLAGAKVTLVPPDGKMTAAAAATQAGAREHPDISS